jgi:NADH-quinone oxidoreductase subunit C
VTTSQSETEVTTHPLQEFADSVAEAVGGTATITFDTVKVAVDPSSWVSAHVTARDQLDLVFFSFLSAVDWSNQAAVGDALRDDVEERFEVITTVADLSQGRRVTFSTAISKDHPTIPTLVEVYAGANWHEREAHEMFGIDFEGHPNLSHLYLPESFVGNPLRKDFPLLSREVKPWPGTVDVEPMPEGPSEENPEG